MARTSDKQKFEEAEAKNRADLLGDHPEINGQSDKRHRTKAQIAQFLAAEEQNLETRSKAGSDGDTKLSVQRGTVGQKTDTVGNKG